MSIARYSVIVLAFVLNHALALPGVPPPTEALSQAVSSGRIARSEAPRMTWVAPAKARGTEVFVSSANKTHLRFTLETAAGESFAAIMYEGDWNGEDRARLDGRELGFLGYWDTYRGQPSFVAVWLGAPLMAPAAPQAERPAQTGVAQPQAPAQQAPPPALLQIEGAAVSKVEKFVSRDKKTHIRFQFVVGSKTYRGMILERDWTSDHLARLRSGRATLIGYWEPYEGVQTFMTKQVRP